MFAGGEVYAWMEYFPMISSGTVSRVKKENAGRRALKYIHNKNMSMITYLK